MNLYKYCDEKKFKKVFLDKGLSLRITQISALNDPFESKFNLKPAYDKISNENYKKLRTKNPIKNQKIKKN
jgi:hypothetical protein